MYTKIGRTPFCEATGRDAQPALKREAHHDPPEEEGVLCLSDGLHEHILDHNSDIRARKALCMLSKLGIILLRQSVWCVSQVDFEHVCSRLLLRQRNIYSLQAQQQFNQYDCQANCTMNKCV